jgi:hypothetical protein
LWLRQHPAPQPGRGSSRAAAAACGRFDGEGSFAAEGREGQGEESQQIINLLRLMNGLLWGAEFTGRLHLADLGCILPYRIGLEKIYMV